MAATIRIQVNSAGNGADKVKKDVADLGRVAKDTARDFDVLKKSAADTLGAAAKGIDKVEVAANGLKFDEKTKRWRNSLGHFASDAELAAAGLDPVKRGLDDVDKKARGAGNGFNAFKEMATGALRHVGVIAVEVGVQAARALGDFVGDSITAAGDFEASVNNLAAISGDALENAGFSFQDVSDKALQLGMDTQFSAKQSIDAMTELVKGGIPVAEVMEGATDATLALAAAAGLELAPAAEIMSKQFGVWAETGITTAEISDLLTAAANASTVGVEDLALGLAQAGGTAKTAGVEYQDLVQTMALLAPNFSSASDAGTSFKTFISRLIPTTAPATEAMIALGLATEDGKSKFFDAQGAFIGMEQAAALLQQQTAHLSEEERLLAFNTIFGADAIRAASTIATAGAEGFNAMGVSMTEAGGAADVAAQKNQGFNFAMEQMKGSMETLQIVIGTALLPVLTEFINNVVTPGINVLMLMSQALGGNDEAMAKLSPSAQNVVAIIQQVVAWVQSTAAALNNEAGPATSYLSDLWTGTLQPALMEVWTVFNDQVLPILDDLAQMVIPLLNSALQVGASFWENILQPAIERIWTFFKDNILPILADVAVWLRDNVPPAVQKLADFLSETLFPAIKQVNDFLDATLIPILEAVGEVLGAVVGVAVTALAGLWTNVLWPALQDVGGWIRDTLGPIFTRFTTWLGDVTGGVDGVTSAVKKVIGWLKDLATSISNLELPDWLTPGSPTPWETGLRGIGDALKADVNPQLGAFFGNLAQATGAVDLLNGLNTVLSNTLSAAQSAARAISNLADLGINEAASTVADAFGGGGGGGLQLPGLNGLMASNTSNVSNSINNSRSMTLTFTANNFGARNAAQDYAVIQALARMEAR